VQNSERAKDWLNLATNGASEAAYKQGVEAAAARGARVRGIRNGVSSSGDWQAATAGSSNKWQASLGDTRVHQKYARAVGVWAPVIERIAKECYVKYPGNSPADKTGRSVYFQEQMRAAKARGITA